MIVKWTLETDHRPQSVDEPGAQSIKGLHHFLPTCYRSPVTPSRVNAHCGCYGKRFFIVLESRIMCTPGMDSICVARLSIILNIICGGGYLTFKAKERYICVRSLFGCWGGKGVIGAIVRGAVRPK